MALPNPLASRWGRLMAFFFLYVTEGIPLGFTATAMVVQFQNAGVRPLAIGVFVGSLYFPWAWKWVVGPFVDLIYSNRLGARRGWILGMQFSMVATLAACMPFEVTSENLQFLTVVILIHNTFCATQDVAIDALACTVLRPNEQGLGNGFMFAGQKIGFALGGACVLYLTEGFDVLWLPQMLQDGLPFQLTYPFVIGCILAVTFLVAWPIREEPKKRLPAEESSLKNFKETVQAKLADAEKDDDASLMRGLAILRARIGAKTVSFILPSNLRGRFSEIRFRLGEYVHTAGNAVFGSRVAFAALILALLPPGAMALDLALQKQVAKEIGFTDRDVANIDVVSSIVWAAACVCGGFISDKIGHVKCLAVYFVLISVATFWCASKMDEAGMNVSKRPAADAAEPAESEDANDPESEKPRDEAQEQKKRQPSIFDRETSPPMATHFWYAVMAYMVAQGLMYGTRTAIFMRLVNPDVAATQFTAYMSMMNLVTTYTAVWQGYTIERFGFAQTLYIDGCVGLISLSLLPFLRPRRRPDEVPSGPESFQIETESDE